MASVFLSYAREDRDFAEVVQAKLERGGHAVFLDLDRLDAGDDWQDKVDVAIRRSQVLVMVMTPPARASEYVAYEWAFALGAGVRVIPLLLEPCVLHPRLNGLHRLDFTEKKRPWEDLQAEVRKADGAGPISPVELDPDLPASIKTAVRALGSVDEAERRAAIATLASASVPAALQLLVGALSHPLRDVRVAAARLFPDRRDPRIVPGLLESLPKYWQVLNGEPRTQVDRTLAEIKAVGGAAIPALLAALADPATEQEPRAWIVDTLGSIGDERGLAAATMALQDPVPGVRANAVKAVAAIARHGEAPGGPERLAPLTAALDDGDPWVRARAATAVAASADPGVPARLRALLRDESEHVREAAARAVGSRRDHEATSELLRLLDGDVAKVRAAAAAALESWSDPRVIDPLVRALQDRNDSVQIAVARSLIAQGERRGADHLRRLVAKDSTEIRTTDFAAIAILIEANDLEAFPVIERRLANTTSWSGEGRPLYDRLVAAGPEGQRMVARLLETSKSNTERAAAALARVDLPEVQDALRRWRLGR